MARNSLWCTARPWRTFFCLLGLLGGMVVQAALGAASAASPVPSWQRIPGHAPISTAALQGTVRDDQGRGIPGVRLTLVQPGGRALPPTLSNAEGIFRLRDLPPGSYQLKLDKEGYQPLNFPNVQLRGGELLSLDLKLNPVATAAPTNKGPSGLPGATPGTTPEAPLRYRLQTRPMQRSRAAKSLCL